jgi:uncharacterized protein YjbJ (UPF0337 family)
MDQDRVHGPLRHATGKMQEELGRATGDLGTQFKGQINQVAGTAQDMYGHAKDAARETGSSLDQWFRHTIEVQPYTTALAALAIGWLLGRMRQPL